MQITPRTYLMKGNKRANLDITLLLIECRKKILGADNRVRVSQTDSLGKIFEITVG